MTGVPVRRALALTGTTVALLMALALPAAAHVEVTPAVAAPGQLQLYTVQVPNELADQATVEVDVTLPTGFTLDVAQSVPGWETVISKTDGAPVAVAWKRGRIPVGTFASFQLQGRNPARPGVLTWRAVQRYERSTVTWAGSPTSESPAPLVQLRAGAGQPATGAQTAPATGPTGPVTAAGADPLARSRAAFAIALALVALGLVLAPLTLAALRRRTAGPEGVPAPAEPSGPDKRATAAARRSSRTGQRRG